MHHKCTASVYVDAVTLLMHIILPLPCVQGVLSLTVWLCAGGHESCAAHSVAQSSQLTVLQPNLKAATVSLRMLQLSAKIELGHG